MYGISSAQLDISAIGAVGPASQQPGGARPMAAMSGAADALGLSSTDLRTALQSGQSLISIASTKGVTKDALVSAMAASIQAANPSMSADQATRVATDVATHVPGGQAGASGTAGTAGTPPVSGHHGHHRHHAISAATDAAAQLLGTTDSDLDASLQNGQTISSIAAAKGVSQTDLVASMSTALQGADSQLSADQANQLATRLLNGTGPDAQAQQWATGTAAASSTVSISA